MGTGLLELGIDVGYIHEEQAVVPELRAVDTKYAFNNYLFRSLPFHFFPLLVILLTLACWWLSQRYLNDCRPLQTTFYRSIESIHMFRKETLADKPKSLYFLCFIRDNFSCTYRHCRFVLECKTIVFRANCRGTLGYG